MIIQIRFLPGKIAGAVSRFSSGFERRLSRLLIRPLMIKNYARFFPHFSQDFRCEPVIMLARRTDTESRRFGFAIKKIPFRRTFSWKRFFRYPLRVKPENLRDIESFLRNCRYEPDMRSRGVRDYWQPPEVFEQKRCGDCEDHALWAWRQLHELGYRTRLVMGRFGENLHVWAHIEINERQYLLETTQKSYFPIMASSYVPYWSAEYLNNGKFLFFEHEVKNEPQKYKDRLRKLYGVSY